MKFLHIFPLALSILDFTNIDQMPGMIQLKMWICSIIFRGWRKCSEKWVIIFFLSCWYWSPKRDQSLGTHNKMLWEEKISNRFTYGPHREAKGRQPVCRYWLATEQLYHLGNSTLLDLGWFPAKIYLFSYG